MQDQYVKPGTRTHDNTAFMQQKGDNFYPQQQKQFMNPSRNMPPSRSQYQSPQPFQQPQQQYQQRNHFQQQQQQPQQFRPQAQQFVPQPQQQQMYQQPQQVYQQAPQIQNQPSLQQPQYRQPIVQQQQQQQQQQPYTITVPEGMSIPPSFEDLQKLNPHLAQQLQGGQNTQFTGPDGMVRKYTTNTPTTMEHVAPHQASQYPDFLHQPNLQPNQPTAALSSRHAYPY